MKKEPIEFPKWINRPHRIIGYEADEVYLVGGTTIGLFLSLAFMRINILITVITTFAITYFIYKAYKFYKEEQTKGALFYLAYERSFIKPKESAEEFKDCENLSEKIIPIGYEQYFEN